MRAVIIVNRRARALLAEGPLLRELSRPRDGVCSVETSSLDDLDRAVRELAEDPPDVVVLAGGDGSFMAGVTALARARALRRIALVPGGTVSTIARDWGFQGDPVKYTRCILDAVAADSPPIVRRPTLRVNERIGFICGAGLVARFFEVYEREGAPGYAGAAKIVARVFAGSFVRSAFARRILDPAPCTIEVDGKRAPFDRVSLVCASVVRDLGLSMRLLYRAGEELDRFHVVATPLSATRLGPQLPLVLAGRPLVGRRVDTLARSLSLRFPPGAGAYVLDGELFRADVVDVTPGPVLDVVTPR
ncbi:MAG TPA: diacylglycerol kinase family protein [Labilithrix sp.]